MFSLFADFIGDLFSFSTCSRMARKTLFSAADSLVLLAMLAQACESRPIRADLGFRREDPEETGA